MKGYTSQRLPDQTIALGDRVYTVGVTLSEDMVFTVHHESKSLEGEVLRDVLHNMRRVLWWTYLAEIKGLSRFVCIDTISGDIDVCAWSGFGTSWHDASADSGAFIVEPHRSSRVRTAAPFVIIELSNGDQEEFVADLFAYRQSLEGRVCEAQKALDTFTEQVGEAFHTVTNTPSMTSTEAYEHLVQTLEDKINRD